MWYSGSYYKAGDRASRQQAVNSIEGIKFKNSTASFANKINTTGDGGVRYKTGYMDRSTEGGYDFTKSFAEQLQDYLNGVFPRDQSLIVGTTPNNLAFVLSYYNFETKNIM